MNVLTSKQIDIIRTTCGNEALFEQIIAILERREEQQSTPSDNAAFYQIFRSSPDSMIISSMETGRYIDVNDSFVRYTGYDREDLIGHTSLELSVWVDMADRNRFIELLKRDGYVTNFEAPYRKKDRSIGIGLVSSQFIILNNEKCLVSITRDITEYKETQRLLTLAEERASVYEEVLNNASHEFRTPLSIINTNVYLAQQSRDQEKCNNYLQSVREQSDTLNSLLENFLLIARLDVEAEVEMKPLQVTTILDTAVNMSAMYAKQQDVTVNLSAQNILPTIQGHFEYLTVTLHHLISNAIEHSPPNSIVNVNISTTASHLEIDVIDTGEGIDPEILPYIFDRFYRGTEARTTRGLGLGLAFAKKIAQIHYGEIRVQSHNGLGSQFTLSIPL